MFGVILATAISGIVSIVVLPKYIYTNIFNQGYKKYLFQYSFVFLITIGIMIAYEVLRNRFVFNITILSFALSAIINSMIIVIFITIIFMIVFQEFRDLLKSYVFAFKEKKRKWDI